MNISKLVLLVVFVTTTSESNPHYGVPIINSTCGSPTLSVPMCYCHRGHYKDWSADICEKCMPGYYAEHNNALGAACHLCSTGRFANETGQSSCKLCPAGKFGNSSNPINPMTGLIEGFTTYGATACVDCPVGFYSIALNQMTNHDIPCEQCPAGKYNDVKGSFKCSNCVSGQYQNELGSSECKLCPHGQFKNASIHLSHTCHLAKPGYYSNNRISEFKCPTGKYSDLPGLNECKLCEPGKYVKKRGAQFCINCDKGKYQPLRGASTPCIECNIGKYSYGYPRVNCTTCYLGSYDIRILPQHRNQTGK